MNVEKVKQLKKAMEILKYNEEQYALKKVKFEEENLRLIQDIKELNEEINECKEILKENAESGFLKDGEKKRLGGIGIRESEILEYNENVALEWAKEKDLFIQLDKKTFEKTAKTMDLGFVTKTKKITVTFPKEIKLDD